MADRSALRVLIVDDDPAMTALVRGVLTAAGFPEPAAVRTGREALEAAPVDVVLLDHQLPDTTGLQILEALRARPGHPSVIMVTGHGGESLAASALRAGADDYLIKDPALAKLLPEVLERVRRTRAVREALAAAERDLVRAERLGAIGELMVTLHHEINNPLMSASTEVQLLLEDPALPPARRESLEVVRDALDRVRIVLRQARDIEDPRTRPYLDSMGMIDLAAQPSPGVRRGDALLYVADGETARVAGSLLRHAGFAVRNLASVEDLARDAGMLGVTLVLVGSNPGDPVLRGFEPAAARGYTLIAVTGGSGRAERSAGADHVITPPLDPGTFAEEVLRAMEA